MPTSDGTAPIKSNWLILGHVSVQVLAVKGSEIKPTLERLCKSICLSLNDLHLWTLMILFWTNISAKMGPKWDKQTSQTSEKETLFIMLNLWSNPEGIWYYFSHHHRKETVSRNTCAHVYPFFYEISKKNKTTTTGQIFMLQDICNVYKYISNYKRSIFSRVLHHTIKGTMAAFVITSADFGAGYMRYLYFLIQ